MDFGGRRANLLGGHKGKHSSQCCEGKLLGHGCDGEAKKEQ
jgi:hypothetical protein